MVHRAWVDNCSLNILHATPYTTLPTQHTTLQQHWLVHLLLVLKYNTPQHTHSASPSHLVHVHEESIDRVHDHAVTRGHAHAVDARVLGRVGGDLLHAGVEARVPLGKKGTQTKKVHATQCEPRCQVSSVAVCTFMYQCEYFNISLP